MAVQEFSVNLLPLNQNSNKTYLRVDPYFEDFYFTRTMPKTLIFQGSHLGASLGDTTVFEIGWCLFGVQVDFFLIFLNSTSKWKFWQLQILCDTKIDMEISLTISSDGHKIMEYYGWKSTCHWTSSFSELACNIPELLLIWCFSSTLSSGSFPRSREAASVWVFGKLVIQIVVLQIIVQLSVIANSRICNVRVFTIIPSGRLYVLIGHETENW